MKKLLLILSAILVSMLGWAASKTTLNPYAYDLKVNSWNNTTQELVVSFKLNAAPNKDVSANNNKRGIQIYAYEPSNPSDKYCIYQVPANEIINNTTLQYTCTIPMDGMSKENEVELRRRLPEGKDLTWEVRVQGVNRANVGTPQNIELNNLFRPYSCHGIAVQNCQDAPDFGSIYVTEASNGATGVWQWITNANKGRSLLKYNPRLDEEPIAYKKSSDFSLRTNTTLEPHRVCVSDDGRIFVTSYNRYDSGNKTIVWEYKNGQFVEVIRHNNNGGARGAYGHRVCGMDVKGSGNNLRILLCFLEESDGQSAGGYAAWANSFRVYEYDLTNLESNKNVGNQIFRYRPTGNTTDLDNGSATSVQTALDLARLNKWYCYTDGLVDIAYAGTNKNDIVLSVDFYNGNVFNTYMVYHKNGTALEAYVGPQIVNKQDHYYGGGGLLVYKDGNTEYAVSGRAQYGEYSAGGTNTETSGRIHFYSLSGQSISTTATYSISNLKTKKIINDMAIDCAKNLYAVSFADGSQGSGRIVAVALPYDGETVTAAPKTEQKFQFNPVKLSEDEDVYTISAKLKGQVCSVYLERLLQSHSYNTICLPFDLNINSLSDGHPYKGATVLAFNDVILPSDANGNILELCFAQVDNGQMNKNTPYLIKPQNEISDKVLFDNVTLNPYTDFSDPIYQVTKDNITFWGIIPQSTIRTTDPQNDVVLILVDNNRLASVTTSGDIRGFRGFFYFNRTKVPAVVGAKIAERKPTPTSIIDLNGTQVDVEKFMREGRVYIRVGESLYTLSGEKVE